MEHWDISENTPSFKKIKYENIYKNVYKQKDDIYGLGTQFMNLAKGGITVFVFQIFYSTFQIFQTFTLL